MRGECSGAWMRLWRGGILGCLVLLTVRACGEEFLIDALSSTQRWALTGHRVCYSLGESRLGPDAAGGVAAVRLDCDLERSQWIGVQWLGGPIPGRPEAVWFQCHGDGSGHPLAAQICDADGREFSVRLGTVDWRGWKRVEVPAEPAAWSPVLQQGAAIERPRWPVTVREFRVSRGGAALRKASVAFSDLRARSVVGPVDSVAVRVETGIPANLFYRPAPVRVRAVLHNGGAERIEGDLEAVLADWKGGERSFPQGRIALDPQEQATRELALSCEDVGAFAVRVRFRAGGGSAEGVCRLAVSESSGISPMDEHSPFGMGLYLPRFRTDAERALALRLAAEAGVKWTRDGLSPAQLEPRKGEAVWEYPKWVSGRQGAAVRLGSGRRLEVPSTAALCRPCFTGELAIAVRLKFLSLDYVERWRTLLRKGEGGMRQGSLFLTVPTRQLGFSVGDGAGRWSDVACAKTNWETGVWYDVLVAHRRSDRSVRWWVDGEPAGAGVTACSNSLAGNDEPMWIGEGVECEIDDLAVFDRAVDPAGLAAAKPAARWAFDEGAGRRIADVAGGQCDITVAPPRAETIFSEARAAGVGTYAILMGVPAWMAGKPVEGMARPFQVMPKIDEWSRTVGRIVSHFRGEGVGVWEVWNEPNIEAFWSPRPDPAEYAALLEATYGAVKRADRGAQVLGVALAGPHGPAQREPYAFVEEVLKRGGGKHMDAIAIHPYRQPRSPEESDYEEDLRGIAELCERHGRKLPIWITEVGWPNGAGGSTEAHSACMLPRAYLLALAHGVRNITWYDFHDDGTDASYNEHNFGIIRNDFTPKPAYFAFRTMARELAGAAFERRIDAGDGMTAMVYAHGERRIGVAWSHRGGSTVAMRRVGRTEAEVVDLMGNAQRAALVDGVLIREVGEDAVFVRGVTADFEVIRPVMCDPPVLKVPEGGTGRLCVVLSNPFDRAAVWSAGDRSVEIAPRGTARVEFVVSAAEAGAWVSPFWRDRHGGAGFATPARVVRLCGGLEPVVDRPEEASREVSIPDDPKLDAADEVTIACRYRADGPTGTWQAPVTKWLGERRNYGIYLGRENGEFCFSATFERGTGPHTDVNSGRTLFDGKWHHLGATYSSHDAEVLLYIDGALVHRQRLDGGNLTSARVPVRLAAGTVPGGKQGAAPRGAVRDVRIWTRALGAKEIASEAGRF